MIPFWSLHHRWMDLWIHPRSSVCPYRGIWETVRYFFLKLDSYIEHGYATKMFQADFLNKPLIPLNSLKNEVFPTFIRIG